MEQTNEGYEKDYFDNESLANEHAKVENIFDLTKNRATTIPALFNTFYKFIENPSTVSVETYKRMVDTDDTIGSGVDFMASALAARLGAYEHPSNEVTQFVNNALEKVDGGWNDIVKEIVSGIWAGFSVMEKIWANTDDGFIVTKFRPLPPTSILFETNRYGDLTEDGILQYQRNYNPNQFGRGISGYTGIYNTTGGTKPDPLAKYGDLPFPVRVGNSYNYLSIRMPVMKCLHYAHNAQGKFGNPYGRSVLRRAYKYWVMKDAFLKMMAVALDRKGTPLTIVYADPGQTFLNGQQYNDSLKNPSQQQRIRGDQAARNAFANIHNDSTIILPGKKDQMFGTDFVPQDSNTDSFLGAIKMCDKGMLKALLIPSLLFTEGETGAYALAETQSTTFDAILDSILYGVKQVIREQYIKELVAYNFPESAWKKDGLGDFTRREVTREERAQEMEMYEKAINIGAIDMNDLGDLNQIRENMGFNKREETQNREVGDDI